MLNKLLAGMAALALSCATHAQVSFSQFVENAPTRAAPSSSDLLPVTLSPTVTEKVTLGGLQTYLFGQVAGAVSISSSGTSQINGPGSTQLGGVYSLAPSAHFFVTGLSTSGNFIVAQPAVGDINGIGTIATQAQTTGTSLLMGNGTGGLQNVTLGGPLTLVGKVLSSASSVQSFSFTNANGITGTVTNSTSTPNLTLGTTISGMVKGNGTGFALANPGTDYMPPTTGTAILYGNGVGGSSNVTIGGNLSFSGGILNVISAPTLTGTNFTSIPNASVLGLAASATTDTTNASNITSGTLSSSRIPTLNQNTTGNAATATTATNVAGGAAGSIAYQTAANTTAMLAAGSGVLVGGSTPGYQTAPTLTGTNFTGIPKAAVTGTAITAADTGTVTSTMIANSGVTAGSYTAANITVNAEGQITAASNGTGSAGAEILISTLTASASSNLAWTGLATYKHYRIVFSNLLPSSSSALEVQVGTGATPTWVTTGYYNAGFYNVGGSTVAGFPGNSGGMLVGAGSGGAATSGTGWTGNFDVYNFLSDHAGDTTSTLSSFGMESTSPIYEIDTGGGGLSSNTTAKTAIRIQFVSGNITSGTASLYGFNQ